MGNENIRLNFITDDYIPPTLKEKYVVEKPTQASIGLKELLKSENGLQKLCVALEDPIRVKSAQYGSGYNRKYLHMGEPARGEPREVMFRKDIPNRELLVATPNVYKIFEDFIDEASRSIVTQERNYIRDGIIEIRDNIHIMSQFDIQNLTTVLIAYEIVC